jgi:precorrin-4/cobalt-precorrin-4 C11-methyltransferase
MEELDRLGIGYEVVPGVTSAFAAAATLGQELTLPGVTQTVIFTRMEGRTPVPSSERISELARSRATLVIYLSVGMIWKVVEECLSGGFTPETPVAVVYRASWPDEQVLEGTLADIALKVGEAGIEKHALIIVGEVLKARREGVHERSRLYDRGFSHEFRKGIIT